MPLPLDKRWFNEFRSNVASTTTNYYFQSPRKVIGEEREKFLANKVENPHFTYPRLNKSYFEGRGANLEVLRDQIEREEKHPVVRQAYVWSLEEAQSQISLLVAATTGDMEAFKNHVEFIFGKPSQEIFGWTVNTLHTFCDELLSSSEAAVQKAAEILKARLPNPFPEYQIFLPPKEVIDRVFAFVNRELGPLTSISSTTTLWQGESLRKVFQEKLHGQKLYDWNAVLTEGQYYISVEKNHKEVRIPDERIISREDVRSLLAHEIGVHVLRRVNGMRSSLLLLGMGLDRYYRGEEGLATLYEEALHGKFMDIISPQRYLAIGLAYGLDGKPRNFREVFEVMEAFFYAKLLQSEGISDDVRSLAALQAWEACRRTYRGVDSSAKGVCFTKDIIYQEGNIRLWEALAKYPKELNRLLVGKYDPANEHHRWILDSLEY